MVVVVTVSDMKPEMLAAAAAAAAHYGNNAAAQLINGDGQHSGQHNGQHNGQHGGNGQNHRCFVFYHFPAVYAPGLSYFG